MKLDGWAKDKYPPLCTDFAEQLEEENVLDTVIIDDETLCYQYDLKAKCQSMEWRSKNSTRPKKPQTSSPWWKQCWSAFWHQEYHLLLICTQRDHCYQTFYVEMLKRFIDAVRHKQGELWRHFPFIFHHDNAPSHSSLSSIAVFSGKTHLRHGSSAILSWLLAVSKIQECAEREAFLEHWGHKSSVEKVLTDIPVHDFKNCFGDWLKCWEHCKDLQEDFFEKL